jgi:ankyrin repeat protein
LIWAAAKGHEVIVKLLLTNEADANVTDANGNSALLEAIKALNARK